jgi:nitrogen fixation/metabolism regulation signal transduction histidine kinase
VKQVGFRGRLFLILLAFAVVPAVALTVTWAAAVQWAIPLVGATPAIDSISASGTRAIAAARGATLTPTQEEALAAHERMLGESEMRARQIGFIVQRAPLVLILLSLAGVVLLGVVASRVAGHLSRHMGRPLAELVQWTELIGRGETLPDSPPRRGAPEFEVLRREMRRMVAELEEGRRRALSAERAEAMRETARQVAHELKNPLTPIRFAVARLKRDAPAELAETVEVLAVESERLERMATSFAQFGRLPEGPRGQVDMGELARYALRSAIPESFEVSTEIAAELPLVEGQHDALARAVTNVLLNAVDASAAQPSPRIQLSVGTTARMGRTFVEVAVTDNGCGIPPDKLDQIWEPYVTTKAGGTGLGLPIVRQTMAAHDGLAEAETGPDGGTTIRLLLPT